MQSFFYYLYKIVVKLPALLCFPVIVPLVYGNNKTIIRAVKVFRYILSIPA